jgi:4-diphosphocytidyl-2C-methyl-D-erythritol kinase
MNPRQSVLIAMFLSLAVYLLANAQASALSAKISTLKQVPPGGGFGGGSGIGGGGAGGSF